MYMQLLIIIIIIIIIITSNNQRLRSAGDNDQRSKCFCFRALLCVSFTQQMVKTHVIRLWVVEGPNWSNCVPCIPYILSGSPNECWLHTCDGCVITTWRLGWRAPLVACDNNNDDDDDDDNHDNNNDTVELWIPISEGVKLKYIYVALSQQCYL